jgi:hypothetical protein
VVRVPGYISRGPVDSRRYQIFWEVVGLEQGPLSLVNTIEELLERKSSGSGLDNREYGRAGYTKHVYPQKLALTSLGLYTSLAGQSHGVIIIIIIIIIIITPSISLFITCTAEKVS